MVYVGGYHVYIQYTKIHPIAALYLNLGIPDIQYEIEKKQLLYLKCTGKTMLMIQSSKLTTKCLNTKVKITGQIISHFYAGDIIYL